MKLIVVSSEWDYGATNFEQSKYYNPKSIKELWSLANNSEYSTISIKLIDEPEPVDEDWTEQDENDDPSERYDAEPI